jgi:hypothetical protein
MHSHERWVLFWMQLVLMLVRPHIDAQHKVHVDDATVLLDAARDAAQFGGTPPALGSPSTEVFREAQAAAE